MKSNLAVAYAVQKKNKKARGGLVKAGSERPTADAHQYAEGGPVRAGSERPTADSHQAHECSEACRDMTVRAHEMLIGGSSRPSADSGNKSESPSVSAASPGKSPRAASSRPTADMDEMGSTRMLAMGGDIEGEDESSHMGTLAEAIADRLHRKMMAQGGMAHDDGLNEHSEEHGNAEDDLSYDALGEEQFDDDQLSDQPSDSNEKGDSEESDSEDKEDSSIISKIRSRSKKA